MNPGQLGKRFFHLATLKVLNDKFVVVTGPYWAYGNTSDALWTDSSGVAHFVAEGGTVSSWIEDAVGITSCFEGPIPLPAAAGHPAGGPTTVGLSHASHRPRYQHLCGIQAGRGQLRGSDP